MKKKKTKAKTDGIVWEFKIDVTYGIMKMKMEKNKRIETKQGEQVEKNSTKNKSRKINAWWKKKKKKERKGEKNGGKSKVKRD